MLKKLLLLLILFCSLPSFATVNLRNGSYTESFIDFIDPDKKGIELKIERHYSSRSVYTGVFGFGWCTFLETRLTITSDGIINLTECGGGLELTYYPKDFDLKSPKDTIKRIVEDYKKKNKMSINDIENLKTQLKNNTKMRFTYANELGLINIQKIKTKNNTFYAKAKGKENITFNGQYYERRRLDGRIERFDTKGKLVQTFNKAGQWIKINYKGQKIAYLVDKLGRRINFSYNKAGKLSKLYNGRGLEVIYTFQGENLKTVRNMWSKDYTFYYDANHNLLQVDFPDKTAIKMSYNVQKDWIKTYTNRINCVQTFDFALSQDDPQNHYWGIHTAECPGDKKYEGKHEFWYKNYSFSKDKYLNRVKEEYRDQFKDAYFHPYLGRPISVRENLVYKGYAYFIDGYLNKREYKLYAKNREILQWNKMTFAYDFDKKRIKSTLKTNLNKMGQVTSTEKMKYSYNRQGLLEKAYTPASGKFISINYDQNGKIKFLKNERKVELKIAYKPGKPKPSEIEQIGLGKIEISYDTQGEVKDVNFSGKRNVSSSVIENFLQMIDFLGPLGEDLKI